MGVIFLSAARRVAKAMTTTALLGPFRLAYDEITSMVPRVGPGAFMLGHKAPDGRFYVDYVGRSDEDLRGKLLDLIGSGSMFKFRQVSSSEAAFQAECELFHAFHPPGNRIHPDRAPGTNWECSKCRLQKRA